MIIAFVILGALSGVIAGTTTFYTGGTVWESMLIYSGIGSITALLTCMTFAAMEHGRADRQHRRI